MNVKTRGEHTQRKDEMKRLWIEQFNTPWITFGGLDIDTVERQGAFVICRSGGGDVELILLEFEDAGLASRFEHELESGARISIEEDCETPGIRKLVVITDDVAQVVGFKHKKKEVTDWLVCNGCVYPCRVIQFF